MALTPTEEALVRQLLDQQAAILSLAGNESTITSKLGATKVNLSDLATASSVSDADLLLIRQGTTDKNITSLLLKNYALTGVVTAKNIQDGDFNAAIAGGTADALTATYAPAVSTLEDGATLYVRATAANTTTTPTFSPNGLPSKAIYKGANLAIAPGDIAGNDHWIALQFNAALDKWMLHNPATGVKSFGFGQTWQNVAGSRALGVIYTNTTGAPIAISLSTSGASSTLNIEVNGIPLLAGVGIITTVTSDRDQLFAIIPPGATYRAAGTSFDSWQELRG